MDEFFEILVRILDYNLRKENIWYGKLKEKYGNIYPNLSKNIDQAFDLGMLEATYEQIDGMWTRCLKISDDIYPLIYTIYNKNKERIL